MNVYGHVPSRRLGKSLGVNNIPYKICTSACIYCQIGKAIKIQNIREAFYIPEKIKKKLNPFYLILKTLMNIQIISL